MLVYFVCRLAKVGPHSLSLIDCRQFKQLTLSLEFLRVLSWNRGLTRSSWRKMASIICLSQTRYTLHLPFNLTSRNRKVSRRRLKWYHIPWRSELCATWYLTIGLVADNGLYIQPPRDNHYNLRSWTNHNLQLLLRTSNLNDRHLFNQFTF